MKKSHITKSIEINAPKEHVWNVLLQDEFTRIWYAEFCEGSHAETDWKVGSKAVFTDTSGSGLISRITANKPFETMAFEHQAIIMNGKEDYESDEAQSWKGCTETYLLSEKNGVTTLIVEQELPENYLETLSAAWDRAIQIIRELSEN